MRVDHPWLTYGLRRLARLDRGPAQRDACAGGWTYPPSIIQLWPEASLDQAEEQEATAAAAAAAAAMAAPAVIIMPPGAAALVSLGRRVARDAKHRPVATTDL